MSPVGYGFIKDCVFESAMDDYEDLATLEKDVAGWAADEGQEFSREAVQVALADLIAEGRMSAYQYRSDVSQFVECAYSPSLAPSLWFRSRRADRTPSKIV